MTSEQSDYAPLVEHLLEGNLVAFLGAGVSAPFQDALGRRWVGVPSAAELVGLLADRRTYIDRNSPFPEACFLFRQRETRADLEGFLVQQANADALRPLPAHNILATLPFSAYITSNFDDLLERSLRKAQRSPLAIIEDPDVSRLRPHNAPVVKLHGCVTRPKTLVAAADEYVPFFGKTPIIDALLRAQLANRRVLFLGFALRDQDFIDVFQQLARTLGDHMPRSTAVVRSASAYELEYWNKWKVEVIVSDLTEFLRGLLHAAKHAPPPEIYRWSDGWTTDPFFVSLLANRALPSETKIIDAFLDHLCEELTAPTVESLDEVLGRATQAALRVLARADLAALKRLYDELLVSRLPECESKAEAAEILQDVLYERQDLIRRFSAHGRELIKHGDRLLIYASSSRVVQLLRGASSAIQASCRLYIAECRPKSPSAFLDAIGLCEELRDSSYDITLIPDAAIGNLAKRSEIDKILLGAHAVYIGGENGTIFVNTCGTQLITVVAEKFAIPILVVAENAKLRPLPDPTLTAGMPSEEQGQLFSGLDDPLSQLRESGMQLAILNLGYDLCMLPVSGRIVTDGAT